MHNRVIALCVSLLLSPALFAQPEFITSLYPPQHGLNVPADAELLVGLWAPLDPASITDSSIYVWSDITGLHRLTVKMENGDRDLRIVPRHWWLDDRPAFNAGERVTVTLTTRLRYANSRQFEGFTWHYTVAVRQNYGGDFHAEALIAGGASTYFYVSDFNGDGWCDLVGNNDGFEQKMLVYLNDQRGILPFHSVTAIVPGRGEVVDFDRDGDQDIFFGFQQAALNDGEARFIQRDFPNWPNGQGRAHDFNNDGIVDYVVAWVISDTIHFGLSRNYDPFERLYTFITPFRRPTLYWNGISYDLNNDGTIDFLYVAGTGSDVDDGFVSFRFLRADSLEFLQIRELPYEQVNFYGNDLNGDGHIDYVIVPGGENRFIIFFNDGTGRLEPLGLQRDSTGHRMAETVEGGDFDGDGDIDLAFASTKQISVMPERFDPDVSIFWNDGSGNFTPGLRVSIPLQRPLSWVLRAIDLDNDGDLDLIGIANGVFYVIANGRYSTSVAQGTSEVIPSEFAIDPIYPNPVTDKATIRIKLPHERPEKTRVSVFDLTGRIVREWLVDERLGSIQIVWNGNDQESKRVSNGLYLVRAHMGNHSAARKFLILQ